METTIAFKVADHTQLFLKLKKRLWKTVVGFGNGREIVSVLDRHTATLAVADGRATVTFNTHPQHLVGPAIYKALCALTPAPVS